MAPTRRTHKYLRETSLRTKWNKLLLKFSCVHIPTLLIRMIMETSREFLVNARMTFEEIIEAVRGSNRGIQAIDN